MPIYAYQCTACGAEHEALQKVSDAPLTQCPVCGQPTLVKKVTAAGFQLKGSGWYVTDFRDKGGAKKPGSAKADAAKDTKDANEAKDGATAGSESKAEAAPAAKPAEAAAPSPAPATPRDS